MFAASRREGGAYDVSATCKAAGVTAAQFVSSQEQRYMTLGDCVRSSLWYLYAVCGCISLGTALHNFGGAGYTILVSLISIARMPKLYLRIRSGELVPRKLPDPRVPKKWELWLWPPSVAGLTYAVAWISKTRILQSAHASHACFERINAINAETFVILSVCLLWYVAIREYTKFFTARSAANGQATAKDSVTVESRSAVEPAASHWWTNNLDRDEIRSVGIR